MRDTRCVLTSDLSRSVFYFLLPTSYFAFVLFEDFAEAFVHRRPPLIARLLGYSAHRLCGLHLRPFSRWHAANLDFIQSPLAAHKNRPCTFAEYWIAAECCRLRFPHVWRQRKDWRDRLPPKLALLCRVLFPSRRIRAEKKYLLDPVAQINAFTAYLVDYSGRPEIIPGDDAQPIRSPWYLHEVCSLLRVDPRLTKPQAWDLPIGLSAWELTTHAEAAGVKLDLVTPEDRANELTEAEFAENERQEALIAAEEGSK
jgi:hypothetical protein